MANIVAKLGKETNGKIADEYCSVQCSPSFSAVRNREIQVTIASSGKIILTCYMYRT